MLPQLFLGLAVCGLTLLNPATGFAADDTLPREFRGVWIASVSNIDWPSKKGLTAEQQQAELVAMLDRCQVLNMNAVILQIRPMCDAFYQSELEPWSEFLTGKPGQDPGYDPLAFAIEQAHARGLELHAWFNPYRAWHPSAKGEPADDHLVKTRPDLAKKYGIHYWLNPTHDEVKKHSLNVMMDVVKRYDIDGIHMDDYFYPYPERDQDNKPIPFPDDDTWTAYKESGGELSREDWRRDAVNEFVEKLYSAVKKEKPWVKVGISPFGIWRPNHPKGIAGLDQYSVLYADAKLWLNKGWVDYYTPQLYWRIDAPQQSFPKLLGWWVEENHLKRNMWPGLYTSRYPGKEIADQIEVMRKQDGSDGVIHFSMQAIMKNKDGVEDSIRGVYKEPALVPASPWLDKSQPARPRARLEADADRFRLRIEAQKDARWFVVQWQDRGSRQIRVVRATENVTKPFSFDRVPSRLEVVALSPTGVASEPLKGVDPE